MVSHALKIPLLALLLTLACERSPSDDDRETTDGDPATAEGCDWMIAESYPVQAHGTCTYNDVAEDSITIPLPAYQPVDEEIRVSSSANMEPLITAFTYDAAENSITVDVSSFAGTDLVLHIRFDGTTLPD